MEKNSNLFRPPAQAVTLALGNSRPIGDANPQRRPPLLLKAKGLKYSSCNIHKITRYTEKNWYPSCSKIHRVSVHISGIVTIKSVRRSRSLIMVIVIEYISLRLLRVMNVSTR